MQNKNQLIMPFAVVMLLLLISAFAFIGIKPVKAQCGSQASSCKNFHEVQGQDPVNNDGTKWHQSHAFGDFCYICHGGNSQAKDKTAAHAGMVSPIADVKASCQQCHAADLQARAKVYADALGVKVGTGTGASATPAPIAAAGTESAPSAASAAQTSSCNEIVASDPNAVNYAQNYDEIVLGKKPTNWGNVILASIIGLMLVGGGGFVITREKLINVKFGDTRQVGEEYPADVVEMLPKIAGLKAGARKSLRNVLDSKKADKVLDLMDAVSKRDEE